MPRVNITVFLVLLCCTGALSAQVIPKKVSLARGTVIDDSTRKSLAFAHIFNESKRLGAISDKNGDFVFRADIGDTIVFTSLGHLGKVIFADETIIHEGKTIYLEPQIYTIDAVEIEGFGSYEDFKKKFLALDLSDDKTLKLQRELAAMVRKEAMQGAAQEEVRRRLIGQPGTMPVTGFSISFKEAQQQQNYLLVLQQEAKQRLVDEKYNREIVKEVTHLPDKEILDFMGFCNFSLDYLYKTSPYDILVRIEAKFREYLAKRNSGKLMPEPKDVIYPEA